MKKLFFVSFLLAFLSASILSAAVDKPYIVRDLAAADNQPSFVLVAPAGTGSVEFLASFVEAAGNQLVPGGLLELGGSDKAILNMTPGRSWGFSLSGKPSGLYKLLLGAPVSQNIWGILGDYVPPEQNGETGVPGAENLFGELLIGPAEALSVVSNDASHVVIYLGKVGALYGGGQITYLVYQQQADGWHAWAVSGESGAYPEATCPSAVTLTLPVTPDDGYQRDRTGYVEMIDKATGDAFPQVLTIPFGLAASFPVVCQ